MTEADWDDSDDDWGDDDDAPSETVRCPSCGADVYEDAEQCPACGEYITRTHSAWQGKPLWWIVLGAIGVIATIAVLSAL
ncbi:MAG: zinc ribbon domain-containing protein [Planctomycetales bacterium]